MILITRHDALAGTTTGRVVAVVTALLLSSAAPARVSGQDWPQWRGPTRDGVVPPAATPAAWPTSFEPSWTLEIGEGYASPIVANGHAFTISRQDPREVVTAVDLGDGSVIWRQSYEAAFEKNPYAVTMAKGPNATPLFADGRLFTVGVSGIVAAWSADDGTALWRHDFSDIFDSSVLFCGTAASPVLANGLVILQVGSDVHGSRVVALDPVDGEIRWTWEGPGPGYASPALIEIGGTAAHLGGSPTPGLWMLGCGLRLMEEAGRDVVHTDLNACNQYTEGLGHATRVACPTLLILGERDALTPVRAAHALADAIPTVATVVLPGAGHALLSERPDPVLDALIRIV